MLVIKNKFIFSVILLLLVSNLSIIYSENLRYISLEDEMGVIPDYDMYVYAVQWGPNYCLNQDQFCIDKLRRSVPKHNMSIHGLWPSLISKTRISDCNQGTPIKVSNDGSSLFTKMLKYWPTLSKSHSDISFWEHEFNKHGYCYNNKYNKNNYKDFFSKTLEIFEKKQFNTIMTRAFQIKQAEQKYSLAEFKQRIQNAVGGNYYDLDCFMSNSKQYLKEIRLYLDLGFNGMNNYTMGSNCHKDEIFVLFDV